MSKAAHIKHIERLFDTTTGICKIVHLILSDGKTITDQRFFDNELRFRIGDPWTGRLTNDGTPFYLTRSEAAISEDSQC